MFWVRSDHTDHRHRKHPCVQHRHNHHHSHKLNLDTYEKTRVVRGSGIIGSVRGHRSLFIFYFPFWTVVGLFRRAPLFFGRLCDVNCAALWFEYTLDGWDVYSLLHSCPPIGRWAHWRYLDAMLVQSQNQRLRVWQSCSDIMSLSTLLRIDGEIQRVKRKNQRN